MRRADVCNNHMGAFARGSFERVCCYERRWKRDHVIDSDDSHAYYHYYCYSYADAYFKHSY